MRSFRTLLLTTTIAVASASAVYAAGPGQGGVVINSQVATQTFAV